MFEKYNEKARRALFFARYEASKLGSKVIESEHLLLGILREGEDIIKEIFARFNVKPEDASQLESIRTEITPPGPSGDPRAISPIIDLALIVSFVNLLREIFIASRHMRERHIASVPQQHAR